MTRRHQRAFSLLELLVTLFVIVLVTSLVTLNVGSGGAEYQVQEDVEAIADTANYALDEAQFSGSDYGLLLARDLDDDGNAVIALHWRQRLAQGWRAPETAPEIFRPILLPEEAEPSLLLDNVEVEPAESAALDPLAGVAPQWLFSANGETQTGELRLQQGRDRRTELVLTWDALARFERTGEPEGERERDFENGTGFYDEG